jgi:hypothetical protein
MSLDRVLGTWATTMQHVAVDEPVVGHQRYERVLGGAFVMLRWTVEHADFPDALALLDETTFHHFDVRGVTRVFEQRFSGSGWTMIRRDADFWQRSSTTFAGADRMEGTGENSHDGGVTWQHDYSLACDRLT